MKTILQDIEVTPILQDIEVTPITEFLYKGHAIPHKMYDVYYNNLTSKTYVKINDLNDFDILINNISKTKTITNKDDIKRQIEKYYTRNGPHTVIMIRPAKKYFGSITYNGYENNVEANKYCKKNGTISAEQFTFEYWYRNFSN